jgi:hypothetical protein
MATPQSSPTNTSVETVFETPRNLLRVHFRGVVTAADVHGHLEDVRRLVAEAGRDFSVLTDLTDLEEMHIDTVRDLARVMDLYLESGVKRVVRVIPDPSKDIGFHLLSMTHYRGRVPIATFATLAEGIRELEQGG